METNNNQEKTELKEWTIMVYLGGDNNLSEECLWSIKEMYRIGLHGGYAVVAQYDSVAGGIFRYDLDDIRGPVQVRNKDDAEYDAKQQVPLGRKDDTDGSLNDRHARLVHGRRDVSASISTLTSFVRHCVKLHPAKHYMLVLSGHAGGAVGRFLMSEGFPPGHFSIRELAIAMKSIKTFFSDRGRNERLDILGLDACAMSMAEVGYELKGLVHYLVGAEGFEPATGWPYHRILEALQQNCKIEPEEFAKQIVARYTSYYADYAIAGRSTDQAALNLDNHERLFLAIKELAAVLTNKIDDPRVMDAIILAHWRAQSYKFEEYVDLWDFCDLLAKSRVNEVVTMACVKVRDAICAKGSTQFEACNYVVKSCYSGPLYQYSRGLSIYLPWVFDRVSLRQYRRRLFFSQDTKWGAFVQKYVFVTRRRPRSADRRQARTAGGEGKFEGTDSQGHRVDSQVDRVDSQVDRVDSEADRVDSQVDRVDSEADRVDSQVDRVDSEADRVDSEADRVDSEADRVDSEADRVDSEADRVDSQVDRHEFGLDRVDSSVDKGGGSTRGKVKNPPVSFVKDVCSEED